MRTVAGEAGRGTQGGQAEGTGRIAAHIRGARQGHHRRRAGAVAGTGLRAEAQGHHGGRLRSGRVEGERLMAGLRDKVVLITGSSRGIGREIALRCGRDGAKVVITGKTAEPHPKLPGTIYSVAEEVIA